MQQTPRLLAVDDNLDSAELIARVARTSGYEAFPVTEVGKLREFLSDYQPDVISLDLGMPEEDGIAVISILQENGFQGHLLIVSGQESALRMIAQRLASARGLKVAGEMEKPANPIKLRKLLVGLRNEEDAPTAH